MAKTYGYIRVSTSTQADKGYGLANQRWEILAWARANGIDEVTFYADEGISGAAKVTDTDEEALDKRTQLLALLDVLQPGDNVVVLNTSRLWRSDLVKVLIQRELMRAKVNLYSIQQPTYTLDSNDPTATLLSSILEDLDTWERAQIAAKLAAGRATKAAQGKKPAGVAPYGYRYNKDGLIEVDDDEGGVVPMIFLLLAQGNSLQKVCDFLNANGTTRRGKPWQKGSVAVIAHNRFYTGYLQHGNKIYKGVHPKLIDVRTFNRAQAQLRKHTKTRQA